MSGALSLFGILLCCAVPVRAGEESGDRKGTPARVEVLEGRAKAALPTGVLNLSAGAPVQRFDGALHFEQAPESRTRIGWGSAASLLLEGRAALEWAPGSGAMPLAWTFAELDSASLEVRRGRVRLELPGGWRGSLQPGAYTLRGLSGESVEFHHAAGLPVTFWPPRAEGEPLPPYTVLPGASVHLLAEARRPLAMPGAAEEIQEPHAKLGFESRPEPASFPSWRDFTWPWKPAETAGAPPSEAPAAVHGPLGERLDATQQQAEQARQQAVPSPAEFQPVPEVGASNESTAGEPRIAPGVAATVPSENDSAPAPVGPNAGADVVEPTAERAQGTSAPARPSRELRRHGRLVLTPYGPRWLEDDPAAAPAPPRRAFLRP